MLIHSPGSTLTAKFTQHGLAICRYCTVCIDSFVFMQPEDTCNQVKHVLLSVASTGSTVPSEELKLSSVI